MNRKLFVVPLLLASSLVAQTQLLRGKVEDRRNPTGPFSLACTDIPLTSTTLDLRALVGQQLIMQVVNAGSPTAPVLDVRSATATAKIFDMGNIRLGRADRWQVNAAPGATAIVFLNATSATSYLPLGPIGTWLAGPGAFVLSGGVVSALGQFEFQFQPPNIPSLVGFSFTGQAVVIDNGRILLSNPDCKEVRSR